MESPRRNSRISPHSTGRQRPQACERCWKRKQKCDRLLPACTACVDADAECIPRRVLLGSTAEATGCLSHASVPNYVETLKRKIGELDSQYQQKRARVESDTYPEQSHSPNHATAPKTPEVPHDAPETAADTTITEQSLQVAMGEIGFLSRNAMAEPRDESRGFPQELGMNNMIRAALTLSGDDPSQYLEICPRRTKLVMTMGQSPKFSKDLALPYLNLYLDHVGVMFLHLEPAEIKRQFDDFFDTNDSIPCNRTSSSVMLRDFNIHMAVAIGMLLSAEPGIEPFAKGLHKTAMDKFAFILGSGEAVDILQCMLSFIVYSMFSSLGGSTWHLVGLAMNRSISMAFHREPHTDSMPSIEVYRRRCIFWDLYAIDRTISCVMDRPFSIEDDDISLKYPSSNESLKSTAEFDPCCHVITHARLMSEIRGSSDRRLLLHYSNVCYWRDISKPANNPNDGSISTMLIQQLTCRALVEVVKDAGFAIPTTSVMSRAKNIDQDIVSCCGSYIDGECNRSEQGNYSGSFIDALDIFAAGVLVIYYCPSPLVKNGIVTKCTALLAILAQRFSSLKPLNRVLWALSTDVSDPILDELPDMIPGKMQAIIHDFVRRAKA